MKKLLLLLVLAAAAIFSRADNGYSYIEINNGQKLVMIKRLSDVEKNKPDSLNGRIKINYYLHVVRDSILDTISQSSQAMFYCDALKCYQHPGVHYYDTVTTDRGLDARTLFFTRTISTTIRHYYYSPDSKKLFFDRDFKKSDKRPISELYIMIYFFYLLFWLLASRFGIGTLDNNALVVVAYFLSVILGIVGEFFMLMTHHELTSLLMCSIPILIYWAVISRRKRKAAKAK